MSTNGSVTDWLLAEDQPAVRYFTLTDLKGRSPADAEASSARDRIATEGWARAILDRQKESGYWESSKSLYRPKYTATNWRMLVLSDMGLTAQDPRIEKACGLFFKEWLNEELPLADGEICIVGNLARFLTRFGYSDHPRVKALYNLIVQKQKEDGGWHCFESDTGTLDCWEGLAAFAALPRDRWTRSVKRSAERGAEFYLERRLMEEGPRYAPWFRLHYPNHYYYDVLVGLDVITRLGYGGDGRLAPSLRILNDKRTKDGKWMLDRIHPDPASYLWGKHNLKSRVKPFALEQAGKSSKWITLSALRVLKRVEES